MTTGTVLSVYHDGVVATAIVRVTEAEGVRDYRAEVDYPTFAALATNPEKLAMLVDAINAVRDAEVAVEAGITKISTWNDDEVTLT